MRYNGATVEKITAGFAEAPAVEMISNFRLIFTPSRLTRRHRSASIYTTGRRCLIHIAESEPGEDAKYPSLAAEGLQVEVRAGAHAFGRMLKPGVYDVGTFLSFCHSKKARTTETEKSTRLPKILRVVRHLYRWLEPGTYEFSDYDDRSQRGKLVPSRDVLRKADRAHGALSETESKLLQAKLNECVDAALRTQSANEEQLTSAINDLYNAFGLNDPRVVLVSSPLAAAVAGCIAIGISHARKQREAGRKEFSAIEAQKSLVFDEMYNLAVQTARYATEDALDESMETNLFRALTQSTRQLFGTASNSEVMWGRTLSDLPSHSQISQEIIAASKAAAGEWIGEKGKTDWLHIARQAQEWLNRIPADEPDMVSLLNDILDQVSANDSSLRSFLKECLESQNHILKTGNIKAVWDAQVTLCRDVLKLDLPSHVNFNLWQNAALAGGSRVMHEDFCIVSDFPEVLRVDEELRLHSENGPAIKWRDGWCLYFWHGIRVSSQLIERPETLTIEQIEREANIEIRRLMIQLYGQARYLLESGAHVVQADEAGVLYRKELRSDEPLTMVKVINSTAEPDGTFKEYFIRVPPHITTAKAAVAWTFDLSAEEYSPLIQS